MKEGVASEQFEKEQERKKQERLLELEKLRIKRLERDRIAEALEQERRKQDLSRDSFSFKEWIEDERAFHLRQAKERAEIRLNEGRPKPIDILYKNMEVDLKYAFEIRPPHEILNGLDLTQLQELESDIDMYLGLCPQDEQFWASLKLLCSEQLATMTGKRDQVPADVVEAFEGQSLEQLKEMKREIEEQMKSGDDPEYWAVMSTRCNVLIAQMTLSKIHVEKLQQRLAQMEQKEGDEERQMLEAVLRGKLGNQPEQQQQQQQAEEKPKQEPQQVVAQQQQEPVKRKREKLILEDVEEEAALDDDLAGVDPAVLEEDLRIARLAEEARELELMLKKQEKKQQEEGQGDGPMLSELEMYRLEANKVMDEHEERFADEVESQQQQQQQQYMHRNNYSNAGPKKPLYFNRVRTGFEWNKYNATHYNADTPPPKVVQGYRFNIFYNDLIDPSVTPTFKVEQIPGNHDWVLLRFHAGPPYLDIVFKIINRKWDRDPKHGFKAVFDRGVLRLWFNFARTKYKR